MKTENIAKLTFAATVVGGITLVAIATQHVDFLPAVGIAVSYLAALALMVLAASDKGAGNRRLS